MPKDQSAEIISRTMGTHRILWLAGVNKYLLAVPPGDQIIQQIWQGRSTERIVDYCRDTLHLSTASAKLLVADFRAYVRSEIGDIPSTRKLIVPLKVRKTIQKSKESTSRQYRIYGTLIKITYGHPELEAWLHPRFAHLETALSPIAPTHLTVQADAGGWSLFVNHTFIGHWNKQEEHWLTGKFQMEILQAIYRKPETEWLGVFHAAGVSNGQHGILFPGDSGNGKSTLSSLLLAAGLTVLADDFLPVENTKQRICSFPAAIALKAASYDLLHPVFPDLKNASEYPHGVQRKTVKYLPATSKESAQVPCKALIFTQYDPNTPFALTPLPREEAFQQLVPDSWISPVPENANKFITWFLSLPSYQMQYSDNKQMIQAVKNLLNDD